MRSEHLFNVFSMVDCSTCNRQRFFLVQVFKLVQNGFCIDFNQRSLSPPLQISPLKLMGTNLCLSSVLLETAATCARYLNDKNTRQERSKVTTLRNVAI